MVNVINVSLDGAQRDERRMEIQAFLSPSLFSCLCCRFVRSDSTNVCICDVMHRESVYIHVSCTPVCQTSVMEECFHTIYTGQSRNWLLLVFSFYRFLRLDFCFYKQ